MMLSIQQQQLPLQNTHGHQSVTPQASNLVLSPLNLQTNSRTANKMSEDESGMAPTGTSGCRRPMLSLNTNMTLSHSRSFGKGSTSLRLDTLSAVSPTMRNTFSNAYAQQQRPSLASLPTLPTPSERKPRPTLLRLDVTSLAPSSTSITSSTLISTLKSQEVSEENGSSRSGSTSISNSSSISPELGSTPYSLPSHHRSILTNSLIPKTDATARIRRLSKPFFPAPKRVSFREPLAEDIQTQQYVHAHYDLVKLLKDEDEMAVKRRTLEEEADKDDGITLPTLQLSTVPPSGLDLEKTPKKHSSPTRLRFAEFKFPIPDLNAASPPAIDDLSPIIFSSPQNCSASSTPSSNSPTVTTQPQFLQSSLDLSVPSLAHRVTHHQRHLKRDSSSSNSPTSPASNANDSDDSCAHTPVAGRNKKRRRWVWTLGPLEGYAGLTENATPDSMPSSHIPDTQVEETSKRESGKIDESEAALEDDLMMVSGSDGFGIEGIAILM